MLVGSTVFLDQCVREHMATTKSTLAGTSYRVYIHLLCIYIFIHKRFYSNSSYQIILYHTIFNLWYIVSTYAASTAPSRLLGLAESKGVLIEGADADLCILTASGQVLVTVVLGDIAFCSPDLW